MIKLIDNFHLSAIESDKILAFSKIDATLARLHLAGGFQNHITDIIVAEKVGSEVNMVLPIFTSGPRLVVREDDVIVCYNQGNWLLIETLEVVDELLA